MDYRRTTRYKSTFALGTLSAISSSKSAQTYLKKEREEKVNHASKRMGG